MWQTEYFVILDHFLPFHHPGDPENKNKTHKDIMILHMCTINDNHMMHGSWDMECGEHNVLSFWVIFCSFTPLTICKIKIFKKMKKTCGDIIILHMSGSWELDCDGQNFLPFWTIFCSFTPLTIWKIRYLK